MSIQLNTKHFFQGYIRSSSTWKLVVFLLVMTPSFFAVAQNSVGSALSVTGQVSVERKTVNANNEVVLQESTLQNGAELFNGDTLVTLANSSLRYELSDGSVFINQESSKITIHNYIYEDTPCGEQNIVDFQLISGAMEFVSGGIGSTCEGTFRIVTDFAEIGASESGAIITTDQNSTQVFVTQGELTGLGIDGELRLLEQGETTIFDASGEPNRYAGNITGVPQSLETNGSDPLVASEDESEDTESASVIFQSFLAVDPNTQTATQEQLGQALRSSINSNPSLYAEFITVAIELGLESPTAAFIVVSTFGSDGTLTEERVADIFLVSTAGIADTAAVEQAILSVDGAVPVDLAPTGTNNFGQGLADPIPTVPIDGQGASPAI